MSRLTFGDVKTACARVLSMIPTDARVTEYVNRAQERLMSEGTWVGTFAKFRVCVTDSCLTWPREVESIRAYALCNAPGTVRTSWYEFLTNGPGIMSENTDNAGNMVDQGEFPGYDDPDGGTDKRYKIYVDTPETTTDPVILQYYNSTGNWVRSLGASGSYIDGEEITIPVGAGGLYAFGLNDTMKSGLVRVIKPVTNGNMMLYEENLTTGVLKHLATWQPGETRPTYRRSMIPGLSSLTSSGATCTDVSVTIIAKLRHINVVNDNDFMILTSTDAFVEECKSIRRREDNLDKEGRTAHQEALEILDKQLNSWTGGGAVEPINMQPRAIWGGGIDDVR